MCTDLRLLPSPASPERCRLHHRSAVACITGAPSPESPVRRRLLRDSTVADSLLTLGVQHAPAKAQSMRLTRGQSQGQSAPRER